MVHEFLLNINGAMWECWHNARTVATGYFIDKGITHMSLIRAS